MTATAIEAVETPAASGGGHYDAVCHYLTHHRKQLLALIQRYETDRDAAEDILSIVTVEALSNLDAFKGEASVATYISRIAKNQAITAVRKSVRRKSGAKVFYAHEVATGGGDDEGAEFSEFQNMEFNLATPEVFAETRQQLAVVEKLLPKMQAKFPVAYATWKLHRIDGLDYSEIEEQTGTPARQAFLHVFRVSQALAEMCGVSKKKAG